MGPRPFRQGNLAEKRHRERIDRLQWSLALSGGGTHMKHGIDYLIMLLQWSLALSGGKTTPARKGATYHGSFNGASPFQAGNRKGW